MGSRWHTISSDDLKEAASLLDEELLKEAVAQADAELRDSRSPLLGDPAFTFALEAALRAVVQFILIVQVFGTVDRGIKKT